jgi:hypothetical protein
MGGQRPRPARHELEAAGAYGPDGDQLVGPIDLVGWPVPVAIGVQRYPLPDGAAIPLLVWADRPPAATGTESARYWRRQRPTRNLLDAFISLDAADPAAIAAFAGRFGPLHLCAHGLPASHRAPPYWTPAAADLTSAHQVYCAAPVDPTTGLGFERAAAWQPFIESARALVVLAHLIASPSQGNDAGTRGAAIVDQIGHVWRIRRVLDDAGTALDRLDPPLPARKLGLALDGAEAIAPRLISDAVSEWLEIGNVRPRVIHEAGVFRLRYDAGGSVFGALAAALAAAVAQPAQWVICIHCARPDRRSRQPRADRRHFCDACRKNRVPARYAERDAARREREAHWWWSRGTAPRDICDLVRGTKLATVERWIARWQAAAREEE